MQEETAIRGEKEGKRVTSLGVQRIGKSRRGTPLAREGKGTNWEKGIRVKKARSEEKVRKGKGPEVKEDPVRSPEP